MSVEVFRDKDGFSSFFKDKDTIKDYAIDWRKQLGTATISSSTWETDGVTIDSSSNTSTKAIANVSAFSSGGKATNTMIATNGLKFQRTLRFYEVEA